MKKITLITFCLTALFAVQACKTNSKRIEGLSKGQTDSLSIALGVYMGEILKAQQWLDDVNYSLMFKTIKDIRDGKDVGIEPMQIDAIVQTFMMKKAAAKETDFLTKNKASEGVVELPSGLQYKIIEEGTGIQPSPTDSVTVNYKGTLIDGTQFDSSYDRGEPSSFALNGVIAGWTEGFQLLKEGTKAILYIPFKLGYQSYPMGSIPPNSTLIFEVELIKVTKVPQPENTK